jgi:hypothetical protein
MHIYAGRIAELRLDAAGQTAAWIECPPGAVPAAGQYLLGRDLQGDEPLGTVLYPGEMGRGGFLALPPLPRTWLPGTSLELRGPLGHGFRLPVAARRVALAGLAGPLERLLPLVSAALAQQAAVAVFCAWARPHLPAEVEVFSLEELPDTLAWADYLALDVSLHAFGKVPAMLGLPPGGIIPCPGQALVLADMPCAGAGACGVCAVPVRRTWKLACSDGPVFNLNELDWT